MIFQRAQAKDYYSSLSEEEKELIAKAIAEDIFFIEETVSNRILCTLHEVDSELPERIRKINGFTIR